MDLAEEPRPVGCRKILSEKGVWRIGYTIDDDELLVTVIRGAHRSGFYD